MTACCAPSNEASTQITFWPRDATCPRSNQRRASPVFRSDAVDPLQTWPAVEIGVKAEDRMNPVVFHHGDVEGVPGRKRGSMLRDLRSAQHVGSFHREDIVDDIQKRLKCPSDGISPVNGGVTAEDFLEHLRIGYQLLSRRRQSFQQNLRLRPVWMYAPHQVHRNIGVNEDQIDTLVQSHAASGRYQLQTGDSGSPRRAGWPST